MTTDLSVFGMGYVGCVSAACFAREGFKVVGVDVSQSKCDLINGGNATILEAGIKELVAEAVTAGRLTATTNLSQAVMSNDLSLVCVGTPSQPNGSLDLSFVQRVCSDIGTVLREKDRFHTVVVRSTVLPGTIHELVVPALERSSGKQAGVGFAVVSNPEFLREGTSVADFNDPPFTLIGADQPEHASPLRRLYKRLDAQVFVTDIRVAEMVKYACNAYHGVKITFANEIGMLCKALGIDSHAVMGVVCEDRKLNVSAAYLRPGFAFGGSCLPKDLRAMNYRARQLDLELPLLASALASNSHQISRVVDMVLATGARRVGVLGLAFKAGTDDLRESPMVTVVERLLGKGIQLAIYDRDVSASRLVGANREYVEREVPHIWTLVRPSLEDVLRDSEAIVVGNATPEFGEIGPLLREGQIVIDLARAVRDQIPGTSYVGLAW